MLFAHTLCVVRGGGDLATGVVYRLRRAGFPVIVLELEQPRVVRRMASVAQAMFDGYYEVGGLKVKRVPLAQAKAIALTGIVPIVPDPNAETSKRFASQVVVDARMAKALLDTTFDDADFVVGLGPGFEAGLNCHAVIETHRGHDLGRVIWKGGALADTKRPEPVMGYEAERVLRAPHAGRLHALKQIGDALKAGEAVARVDSTPVVANFNSVLRGLMAHDMLVKANEKIGDLDPRQQRDYCFTISDKALAVGGGVLEAVFTWMHQQS